MNFLASVVKEILGLFVDDGSLAIGVLASIGLLALAAGFVPAPWLGAPFFAALCALLVENTLRSARKR